MDLLSLLDSWYIVGWLLGAGFVLRCGAATFDFVADGIKWLLSRRKKP